MSGGRVTWVDMLGAAEAEVGGPGGVTSWSAGRRRCFDVGAPGLGVTESLVGAGEAADWGGGRGRARGCRCRRAGLVVTRGEPRGVLPSR